MNFKKCFFLVLLMFIPFALRAQSDTPVPTALPETSEVRKQIAAIREMKVKVKADI